MGVASADHRIDVILRWDHRVTDAAVIARVLTRLEQVLNTEISAELLAPSARKRAAVCIDSPAVSA